ncbi:MAG TPA: ferritin-like domain-containing protein [Solirubrobacteraceae bacterium]|jgi:hypothetical protein|nr:ferritin-like domain-containing protein [Solirubrobacteraceae bacterium]
MDAPRSPSSPFSRRRLIGVSGGVLGAAVAAGLGGCDRGSPAPPGYGGQDSENSADAQILNISLDLEHEQVAAYTAAIGLLGGRPRRLATVALSQERIHVSSLQAAIKSMLGVPNPPRRSYRFAALSDAPAALPFLSDLENTAIAGHIDGLAKLSHPRWRALVAAILTADASHLAVLSGQLRRPLAPVAFVTGRA